MQLLRMTFSLTPAMPWVLLRSADPSIQLHEYNTTPGWSVFSSALTPENSLASVTTTASSGASSISQYPL